MDIVIPFKHSRNKDEELRYALRGIQKNFSTLGKIIVVGDKPLWKHTEHLINIPCKDSSTLDRYIDRNIFYKLLRACDEDWISEDFLYHDDDTFLLKPYSFNYYHKGQLWDGTGIYQMVEKNTKELLGADIIVINNCNVHCPRVFNKNRLRRLNILDWKKPYGYQINTCYAYVDYISKTYESHIEGVEVYDLKIKRKTTAEHIKLAIHNREFFSVHDNAWNKDMVSVLEEIFPQPSIYEAN